MSKLSDYSKFDNLPDDSDEESNTSRMGVGNIAGGESAAVSSAAATSVAPISDTCGSGSATAVTAPAAPAPIQTKMTKKNDDGRYVFECNGRKIYEWDQNLEGM